MVDAWQETALVTIRVYNGDAYNFGTLTESIDIDLGDKDIEGLPLINGGRLVKFNPEADTTITLDLYPVEAGNVSAGDANGIFDLFAGITSSTQPISINNSRTRTNLRLAIMWTDNTTLTSAEDATSDGDKAMRLVFTNAYCTSAKPSFTDGILKVTATFKCAPYKKDGTPNITFESTDGTAAAVLSDLSGTATW